ncbi:acyl-CoA dehydrogenase family protein [Methylobacterium sp.]|uniref:acyl-CoA dehydrogenase family protein n=1 Tax=Methylobacterium sp. TaxID=409 RepID=UPI000F9E29CC|nr:acyl-CoA dehydrogenase family protein [Methylobacterium sp.]RUP17538.1 MAG: acyl-CoA dehydrogenase [Methylobacterium sp.]
MDQWTRLDPIYDSAAAARAIAAAAPARADAQDHDHGFPQDDIADLARLGLLAAPVPVDHGGAGLGTEPGGSALAEVLRLVGYGSLALGRLYEGHVNALELIARYGAPAQRVRLFADARAGHLFGVWNTEPGEGGLRIEASDASGHLRGVKTYASGAGFVTRALVTAGHPAQAGTAMMVVPIEAGTRADLAAWRAQGMRASATGTVDFTGLAFDADQILGAPDDYFRQPGFSGGAWRFAAVQLGGIEAVYDAWRGHLDRLGRGGDPHQLARLGEGAIAVEGARLWVERGAQIASDAAMPPERVVAYINLVRLAVERAGLDVLQLAQRSVGLQGFLRGHPLERLSRDLATYLRQPGPDRALTSAASEILRSAGMAGDLWTENAA